MITRGVGYEFTQAIILPVRIIRKALSLFFLIGGVIFLVLAFLPGWPSSFPLGPRVVAALFTVLLSIILNPSPRQRKNP